MDYRMLGPLEVRDHSGEPLPLGAGRPRVLLGLLLVRANELVTSERVVAELWGERPPATAAQMVQNADLRAAPFARSGREARDAR